MEAGPRIEPPPPLLPEAFVLGCALPLATEAAFEEPDEPEIAEAGWLTSLSLEFARERAGGSIMSNEFARDRTCNQKYSNSKTREISESLILHSQF
jgi:hypothetical protein